MLKGPGAPVAPTVVLAPLRSRIGTGRRVSQGQNHNIWWSDGTATHKMLGSRVTACGPIVDPMWTPCGSLAECNVRPVHGSRRAVPSGPQGRRQLPLHAVCVTTNHRGSRSASLVAGLRLWNLTTAG